MIFKDRAGDRILAQAMMYLAVPTNMIIMIMETQRRVTKLAELSWLYCTPSAN